MNTPFGVDFESLTLEHLARWFDEPRAEGLTWEAKGGQIRKEHVREGVCGFANSVLGGYLVLGVSRADPKAKAGERCQMIADGWESDDPETWIGSVLEKGGVSPRPWYSIRTFALPDSARWVAVIHVAPSPVPPCITLDGEVFERLAGQTWRVNSSDSLRSLFARGEAAQEWAKTTSASVCEDLYRSTVPTLPRWALLVAVAAPASSRSDLSPALFRRSTAVRVTEMLRATSRCDLSTQNWSSVSQESFTAWVLTHGEGHAVRIYRRGGVALEVGAYGPSFVTVRANRQDPNQGGTDIVLWSSVDHDPSDDELSSVSREAGRTLGKGLWEPEPGMRSYNRRFESATRGMPRRRERAWNRQTRRGSAR